MIELIFSHVGSGDPTVIFNLDFIIKIYHAQPGLGGGPDLKRYATK